MKRILAMLLSVICVLSFTCVSTYADEKSEDEEKAASIAESYLSAAAKNMWLYESNNLAEHTIQELVDPSGNSLLSDMSADVNTQKILSSMDNITFVQEKSKYFREMRQRQDIQRNDFALEYTVTSASIEDNVATLSIIEHISFHYSSFPDTLSELVNYYDVDLIKCNGSWYVSDVTSTNDDFDAIYKGSEFTAEKADEIIALRIIYIESYNDRPMAIEQLKELYGKLKAKGISVERLWDCYAIKKPDKVKRGTKAQLTDLISIIRFEMGYTDNLSPFADKVNYNFMQWTFKRNAGHIQFTEEQMEWLRLIKDHIATSLSILPEDLDLTPFDKKGGLLGFYESFGDDYEVILNEMNRELVA